MTLNNLSQRFGKVRVEQVLFILLRSGRFKPLRHLASNFEYEVECPTRILGFVAVWYILAVFRPLEDPIFEGGSSEDGRIRSWQEFRACVHSSRFFRSLH